MTNESLKPKTLYDFVHRMDEYISVLRLGTEQSNRVGQELSEFMSEAFTKTYADESLKKFAVDIIDEMYVQIFRLSQRDGVTDAYFGAFISQLVTWLRNRNVLPFYIVDNSIRDDRFKMVVELFELAGFGCVHPYVGSLEYKNSISKLPSKSLEIVIREITEATDRRQPVLYVEKDDSINYLKDVLAAAGDAQERYVCAFRNSSPDSGKPAVRIMGNMGGLVK